MFSHSFSLSFQPRVEPNGREYEKQQKERKKNTETSGGVGGRGAGEIETNDDNHNTTTKWCTNPLLFFLFLSFSSANTRIVLRVQV